ncbi:MAG: dialkylresorcinol condensing enzyme [Halioglobus sp.]|nr:dialkylresorcinol condensing enzyme [Halioglobus sp.]
MNDVVRSIAAPLEENNEIEVSYELLRPQTAYPFPWPFFRFFDTFPETVYAEPEPIAPLSPASRECYDLVILAYQVWFLSPAQPAIAFLNSPEAPELLRDTPVITLIACRNMWLMAQETMKERLDALGARLIDNIVLTDPALSGLTFFSTPMWVLTGYRGPWLGGLIPAAGVSAEDVANARRFGDAIARQLPHREDADAAPMLAGLGAVSINEKLIASERIAIRSFRIWGGLLRLLGKPGSPVRRLVLVVYILFLLTMILTVVPVTALLKVLFKPLMRERIAQQRRYYSAPSGEDFTLSAAVK